MPDRTGTTGARHHLIRWTGLLGAVGLAVAGFLGGALPDPPAAGWAVFTSGRGALSVLAWLAGTAALVWAWWSARHGVPSVRWALVTVGLWALPLLVAPPLASRDIYSYACQGWVYGAGGDPYGGVAGQGCPWIDAVAPLWRDSPAPYGPVFVWLAGLAVTIGAGLTGTLLVLRLFAVAGLLLIALTLPGLARRCGLPAGRALWLTLACPVVLVHLVSGGHNDALMVGLLVAGLWTIVAGAAPASGGAPSARFGGGLLFGRFGGGVVFTRFAGGVLLGLAVGVKATALVVLPFAAVLAVSGPRRPAALVRAGAPVLLGAAAAVAVASAWSGLGLGWVAGLTRSGDSRQWTSPPTAVGLLVEYLGRAVGVQVAAIGVARLVALVLLAGFLVLSWWWVWRGGGPLAAWRSHDGRAVPVPESSGATSTQDRGLAVYGAGIALAATLVAAPVFYPWYLVWPLVLLAAAAYRTRWFLLPVAVCCFLVLPDGSGIAAMTKAPGTFAMCGLIAVLVVRTATRSPTIFPAILRLSRRFVGIVRR
ncbi:polyprenol phosphomannose-dependent alpha 1,6 mannosyltransferase MptB [Micromonospora sp. NBC_01813]|uniref:polyprenol phosphomannose-dependent alpha 1,6 mannosyltransferase MptB n=1 Tax=Micromonospora sp. NBC_01813 TaxID=2975988 RepID=UPI002DDAF353|nr:polyprenol phosphomannose-dependent alpha 1,6 mannosyltransferase MptB [Micromonospora sp. NBC_01813]WSA09523.1 polyprenol phosphomannose-dependent alpha 1,6 mannosyltransferase MptB [Micromonospora sp. NBC_01813]